MFRSADKILLRKCLTMAYGSKKIIWNGNTERHVSRDHTKKMGIELHPSHLTC